MTPERQGVVVCSTVQNHPFTPFIGTLCNLSLRVYRPFDLKVVGHLWSFQGIYSPWVKYTNIHLKFGGV
jgi:hypothetical protein